MRLDILLREDRTRPGTLTVMAERTGRAALGPFDCLGKADSAQARSHGNPERNPEYPYGDTPLGEWLVTDVVPTGTPGLTARSYGPFGALNLEPVAGQCVRAYANGRHGIWIHAGDPSAAGRLRPTYGCVRLSNEDMQRLVAAVRGPLRRSGVALSIRQE